MVILFQCSCFFPIWNPLFVIVSVEWFAGIDVFLFIVRPDWTKDIKWTEEADILTISLDILILIT